MKVNAIRTNLVGTNFASRRKEAPEGYEWARDYGCPEGGLYLRQVDKDTISINRNPELERIIRSYRQEAPEGYEWAKDDGCPEGGLYLREIKDTRSKNKDPMSCCPKGHVPYYTYDGRCIYIPTKK